MMVFRVFGSWKLLVLVIVLLVVALHEDGKCTCVMDLHGTDYDGDGHDDEGIFEYGKLTILQ